MIFRSVLKHLWWFFIDTHPSQRPAQLYRGYSQDFFIEPIAGQDRALQKVLQHTQMLHVWNIYLHLGHVWGKCIGKYTIHGASWIAYFGPCSIICQPHQRPPVQCNQLSPGCSSVHGCTECTSSSWVALDSPGVEDAQVEALKSGSKVKQNCECSLYDWFILVLVFEKYIHIIGYFNFCLGMWVYSLKWDLLNSCKYNDDNNHSYMMRKCGERSVRVQFFLKKNLVRHFLCKNVT